MDIPRIRCNRQKYILASGTTVAGSCQAVFLDSRVRRSRLAHDSGYPPRLPPLVGLFFLLLPVRLDWGLGYLWLVAIYRSSVKSPIDT